MLLMAALTVLAAACGNDSGTSTSAAPTSTFTATRTTSPTQVQTPPASATPSQGSSGVDGLAVVNTTVPTGSGDALGAPPAAWQTEADAASFTQSLAFADWSVDGADAPHGMTGPDGAFTINGLEPGSYTLTLSKTLDGNLAGISIPFAVGSDGNATLLLEVSWGLVKSIATYTQDGGQVREVRTPSGSFLITRDGQVRAFGDASRTFTDPDGDGRFDSSTCLGLVPPCNAAIDCPDNQVCNCAIPCTDAGTCPQPGDRCVCVPSCPACDD